MKINLPFDTNKPISAEASVVVDVPHEQAFTFVAEHFFENYQKWAPEIVELKPIKVGAIAVGAKARQVRLDRDEKVESIFQVTEFKPHTTFEIQGINAPYKQTYLTLNGKRKNVTELKFKFELLEVELFMRPFTKLIQAAMEDGVEATVDRIKSLLKPYAKRTRKRVRRTREEKKNALCNR